MTNKPRPINEMKCPFMTDDKGEFLPCWGDCCMAYSEYDYTPILSVDETDKPAQPIIVRQCRRLGWQVAPPYGCV